MVVQLTEEKLNIEVNNLPNDNINIGNLCISVMKAMDIDTSCTKPADVISFLATEIDRQKSSTPYNEYLYECVYLTNLWYTYIQLVKIKAKEKDLEEMRTKVSNSWKRLETII